MGCTAGKNEEHKVARWYNAVLPHRRGSYSQVPKLTENRLRYLPLEIKGCRVLKEVDNNSYVVDNSELKDRSHGVCFRLSKSIHDKDGEHVAYWNSVVCGERNEGWLLCDLDQHALERLERLETETPIETLQRCGHKGRASCAASSSSNVDGRWVARGHTGSKVIDGDVVRYGAGVSTTMRWEGLNCFSINVMGERRRARLIEDTLVWNDGDVWTRDGRDRHCSFKQVDCCGDRELDEGTALMPPFVGICQKGLKPNSPNQDAWSVVRVEDHFSIYSVYDGHGPYGHDVANLAKDILPCLLLEDDRLTGDVKEGDVKEMFMASYRQMHMLIDSADAHERLSARWSGSTATTVLHNHRTNRLTLAHVGDSSVVLGGWDGSKIFAQQLTRDHKPSLKDEMSRVIAAGGQFIFDGIDYRVYNKEGYGAGLNMTRSLGDLEAHRETGLIADPEVREYQVSVFDRVLLLCSDGVWEFMTPQEAVDLVLKFSSPKEAAEALVKDARKRWTIQAEYIDDITALVIPLANDWCSPRRSPVNKASSGGA